MKDDFGAEPSVQLVDSAKVAMWYWVLAVLGLLWFLMDMSAFIMRVFMLDSMLSGMPENQQNLYLAMPLWVNIVFALEVFGGLLGCIALVFKKAWALSCFSISILGVLTQTFYLYFLSDAIAVMGAPAVIMPLLAILIGSGMIVLARTAIVREWIK